MIGTCGRAVACWIPRTWANFSASNPRKKWFLECIQLDGDGSDDRASPLRFRAALGNRVRRSHRSKEFLTIERMSNQPKVSVVIVSKLTSKAQTTHPATDPHGARA